MSLEDPFDVLMGKPAEGGPSLGERATRLAGVFGRRATPPAAGMLGGAGIGTALLGPIGTLPGAVIGGMTPYMMDLTKQIYNAATGQARPLPSEYVDQLFDELGFPRAETPTERVVGAGAEALAAAPAALGGLSLQVARQAPTVARGVVRALGQQPGRQIAAAAPAGGTAQYVAEKTENPYLGMAAGVAAGAPFGMGASRGGGRAALTRQQVRARSKQAYQEATDAGVVIRRNSLRNAVQEIAEDIRQMDYDADIHKTAAAVMKRLEAEAEVFGARPNALTLDEMEILRRVARNAERSLDESEAAIGARVVDELDDFVNTLQGQDLLAGDAAVATAARRRARDLWRRQSAAETVETAIYKARNAVGANYSQAGILTAIQRQFRAIADNPRRMAQFTAAERDQILIIVRGTKPRNILAGIGRLAPKGVISGGGAGPVAAVGAAGYALGGAAGGAGAYVGASAVTHGARYLAQAWGLDDVAELTRIILGGGQARSLRPTMQPSGAVRGALATTAVNPRERELLEQ